jgi:hypothetical protein
MLSRGRTSLDRELSTPSRPSSSSLPTAVVSRGHASPLLVALASSPAETVELGRWPRWLVPGLPREMAGHPSPPNRATPTDPRRV